MNEKLHFEVEDPEINIVELGRLYYAVEAAAQYYHGLLLSIKGNDAFNYLGKRGISSATIATFRLGYSPKVVRTLQGHLIKKGFSENELLFSGLITDWGDRFRHKLIIPITDIAGRVVGFGTRVLDDSEPKYKNSPQSTIFHKSYLLYGLYQAKDAIRDCGQAVIVEGYFDVLTAHQYGFKNTVGVMGSMVTVQQMRLLKGLVRKITVAFDGDAGGESALLEFVKRYEGGDYNG